LVRRYGKPEQHRHSVQLEINRKLYMDENSLALHAGFETLQGRLQSLVKQLLAYDPR
jgi:N-formylglutamate deformylase